MRYCKCFYLSRVECVSNLFASVRPGAKVLYLGAASGTSVSHGSYFPSPLYLLFKPIESPEYCLGAAVLLRKHSADLEKYKSCRYRWSYWHGLCS